jgi:hypothetical protein
LLKPAIKKGRLCWLKSIDDNLKTKPKDFGKYASKFKKNDHVVTQLKVSENVITQPQCIVEAFAGHFSSIFNFPSSVIIPNNACFTLSHFLNVPLFPTVTLSRQFDVSAHRSVSVQIKSTVLTLKVAQ